MGCFKRIKFLIVCSLIIGSLLFVNVPSCFADLYLNILAVNGTEEKRDKKIEFYLPKELSREDVLDTAGLTLEYDVSKATFYVHGTVSLEAKETRTYKILIKDIWQINQEEIEDIKEQIDVSYERLVDTDLEDVAKVKKESLNERLDYVVEQQESFNDNIEERIDRYRIYRNEISKIRKRGLSVKYWRDQVPEAEDKAIFNYTIEVENPTSSKMKVEEKKYYLPEEVLPEHIQNAQGFVVRYDIDRQQSYLTNVDELKPNEIKRYNVEIEDVWSISQTEIDNLKDRSRKTYKLLEPSKYRKSADYLIASIKKHLGEVEESQLVQRNIGEHISEYRVNIGRFNRATSDVKSLEELLEAVRENLERSKVKNVLQKIRSFRTVAEIAASIFKKKKITKVWKIIMGIVIFVGIYTFLHFTFWGKKSSNAKEAENKKKQQSS